MKVWEWRGAPKYAEYTGSSAPDDRKLRWYIGPPLGDPLPVVELWEPATLSQYLGEGPKFRRPKQIGDAPAKGVVNLISPRAIEPLRDIWDRDALLYPVLLDDAPGETYFMVVVKTQLGWDCVDESMTEYGITKSDDKIYALKRWGFVSEKIGDHDLFTLPHNSTAYFVTQRFVDRVLAAKLKGFQFGSFYLDPKPLVT